MSLHIPHRRPGEEIHLVLRKHWIVLVPKIFLLVVMLIVPVIAYVLAGQSTSFTLSVREPLTIFLILLTSWYYLFTWLIFFHDWVDYYLDLGVVTNERILDIEQRGLFSRVISEISVDNVQEVTNKIHGFFATFLNYGYIEVQTAGAEKNIEFVTIPDPVGVSQTIIRLSKEFHKKKELELRQNGVVHPTPTADPQPVVDNEIDFKDEMDTAK